MEQRRTAKESMSKLSRTKGHSFEREIAVALRGVFPGARRHLEYHEDDANGVDLIGTGRFKFQCKRLRKYASITKIDEIMCEPAFGDVPVLVTKGDGTPIMAVLAFADLLDLIRTAQQCAEKGKN